MTTPVAGWYPDPGNPSQIRYWDGSAWTDQTAPLTPTTPVATKSRRPLIIGAIVAVILLIGGGAAAVIVLRDDQPETSEVPSPIPHLPGTSKRDRALADCRFELSEVQTAISAAETANQLGADSETPDNFLLTGGQRSRQYWTWERTDDGYRVAPVGSPPCKPSDTTETTQPSSGEDSAAMTNCVVEKALVQAAIAGARAANQIAGMNQTPDDLLPEQEEQYYTWTGSSPDTWALSPIGSPPC